MYFGIHQPSVVVDSHSRNQPKTAVRRPSHEVLACWAYKTSIGALAGTGGDGANHWGTAGDGRGVQVKWLQVVPETGESRFGPTTKFDTHSLRDGPVKACCWPCEGPILAWG